MPEQAAMETNEHFECPGIKDSELQAFAQLPPLSNQALPSQYPPYYLEVKYFLSDQVTRCTTLIRAHACSRTATSPDELCNACKDALILVRRKKTRYESANSQEIGQFCPLNKVSKDRLANELKITRIEKVRAQNDLEQIRSRLAKESLVVSEKSHANLTKVIEGCQMEEGSFVRKFWEEQQKAFHCKSGGMRWHPMMVRFAVLLHSQSPSAYRSLRELGVLKLPAESTLRDYTNVLHPHSGFRIEVFEELKKETADIPENRKWVCLLFDELSIKSGLVYDQRGGELVGFIDEYQRNAKSAQEEHLATHALVFMVVGLNSNIKKSLGYFPTRTATADQIFPHLWRAVGLLESVSNLKV